MNTICIIGNLTRDPEVKKFESGTSACTLSIANNNRYKKNNGEVVDNPTFVDVRVVGVQAENAAKYLSKGSKVGITGRLDMASWEDNGQKRSKLYIFTNSVEYLDSKGDATEKAASTSAKKPARQAAKQTDESEGLPW